jgi:hypothetical protein
MKKMLTLLSVAAIAISIACIAFGGGVGNR